MSVIPGPDPGACPKCGGWRKAGVNHNCPGETPGPTTAPAPTWREALLAAFAGVDTAYARRAEVVKAAHDAGLSLRAIADVVGISAAGVHRIVGKMGSQPNAAALLDTPAALGDQQGRAHD